MTQPHEVGTRRSAWAGLDAYPRFYAPAALLLFSLSFADLFDDRVVDNRLTHFGSLWEIAATPGGGPGIMGIMLMFAVVALLVRMSIRVSRSAGWPGTVAALVGLALIMLYVRPGTGSPPPELASGGAMLTAVCFALVVVTLVQIVHLARIRTQVAATRQP